MTSSNTVNASSPLIDKTTLTLRHLLHLRHIFCRYRVEVNSSIRINESLKPKPYAAVAKLSFTRLIGSQPRFPEITIAEPSILALCLIAIQHLIERKSSSDCSIKSSTIFDLALYLKMLFTADGNIADKLLEPEIRDLDNLIITTGQHLWMEEGPDFDVMPLLGEITQAEYRVRDEALDRVIHERSEFRNSPRISIPKEARDEIAQCCREILLSRVQVFLQEYRDASINLAVRDGLHGKLPVELVSMVVELAVEGRVIAEVPGEKAKAKAVTGDWIDAYLDLAVECWKMLH